MCLCLYMCVRARTYTHTTIHNQKITHARLIFWIPTQPLVMGTGTAASPFIAHNPHLVAIKGRPLEFKVHAFDAASRSIKFRLGDNDDHGVGLSQAAQVVAACCSGLQRVL